MSGASKVAIRVVLVAWAAICLFPIYWLAVTSIKGIADIDKPPTYLPYVDFSPSLKSWRFILFDQHENLVMRFLNSVTIAGASTALTLTIGGMVLYGLTRFPVTRRGLSAGTFGILAFMLATRVLPPIVVVLPLYTMAEASGLRDTLTFMILVYAAVNLPVAIWLLQPVLGPRATEQEESAQLDGASHIRILFTVLFPMVLGGLTAAGLVVFLLCWNEYLFAAFLTADHALTLPPWMVGQLSMKEAQVGGGAEELGHLSAAAVLMIAPTLALSLFIFKSLGRAFTSGR